MKKRIWLYATLIIAFFIWRHLKQQEINVDAETSEQEVLIHQTYIKDSLTQKMISSSEKVKMQDEKINSKKRLDYINHCFASFSSPSACDKQCLIQSLENQNSKFSKMVAFDWSKPVQNINLDGIDKNFELYKTLSKARLLLGATAQSQNDDQQIESLLNQFVQLDPSNYFTYLMLASYYEDNKKFDQVRIVLSEMDAKATHYNSYWSDWAADFISESASNIDTYWASIEFFATMPLPSIKLFKSFPKKYKFNHLRLAESMIKFDKEFREAHPNNLIASPLLDYFIARRIDGSKSHSTEELNQIYEQEAEVKAHNPMYFDFPEKCNKTDVEAWFQKHRSEIH